MATPPPPPNSGYSQDDCLSNECKELLSTLPTRKGWMDDTMYRYEGFWYLPMFIQGLLGSNKHFQARDSDTILVTNPKSGTTWLAALAYTLVNRSRFGLDQADHPLLTTSPHDLVPALERRLYCDASAVPDLSGAPSPRLFNTHLPVGALPRSVVAGSSCKVVYLCRNPKDVFVSMYHYLNKLKPEHVAPIDLEHVFEKFCGGESLFGPFWDHALGYWMESIETPSKVLFLKYEDLKEQPAGELRRLAVFLGCPFSDEEEKRGVVDDVMKLCSFDNLSNLEVNKSGRLVYGQLKSAYFRKGTVGDWANVLTPEMAEKIDRITESKLGDSGLKL